jgi:hypothetical protein
MLPLTNESSGKNRISPAMDRMRIAVMPRITFLSIVI